MNIFVFKTDIRDIYEAASHLNSMQGILKWNFDLEDIDNILRVEAVNLSPRKIENTLKNAGFFCEELSD